MVYGLARKRGGRLSRVGVCAAIILVLGVAGISAHSWYQYDCCADNHCAPVPSDSVTINGDAYRLDLEAGEHHMLRKRGHFSATVPFESPILRRSFDEQWHACLVPTGMYYLGLELRCLYIPDRLS